MGFRFEADNSQHRLIFNNGLMVGWIRGLGDQVAAAYTAGTKKRTGRNAAMVRTEMHMNATHLGDRPQVVVTSFGPYNMQREFGGQRNRTPERSLWHALAVAGGDRNVGTLPGRFVGGGGPPSVKSFRKRGR